MKLLLVSLRLPVWELAGYLNGSKVDTRLLANGRGKTIAEVPEGGASMKDSIFIQSKSGSSAAGAFCIDSSHGAALDSPSGTASCAQEPRKIARGVWMRRSLVSGLIGSLFLVLAMVGAPTKSSASVGIFVSFGPPAIPFYVQPPCPAVGF